jgi:hypothetical protein
MNFLWWHCRFPHPEEAAKRLSRRRHSLDPAFPTYLPGLGVAFTPIVGINERIEARC